MYYIATHIIGVNVHIYTHTHTHHFIPSCIHICIHLSFKIREQDFEAEISQTAEAGETECPMPDS